LLRAIGWQVEKDKPLRRTLHRRIQVLDNEGVNYFSTMDIPFDGIGESIFINRLEVKTAAGEIVSRGSVDDAYVVEDQDHSATYRKMLRVQAPGLKPGLILEAEITIQDHSNLDRFEFERCLFGRTLPCANDVVYLRGDVSLVRAELVQSNALKIIRSKDL